MVYLGTNVAYLFEKSKLTKMISIKAELDVESYNETHNNILSDFINDYRSDDYMINNVARSAYWGLQLIDSVNKLLAQTDFGILFNNVNELSS